MASRTEAEVRRLLGELGGRKLVAARLLTVERLRTLLASEAPDGAIARLAVDGLLHAVVDGSQPAQIRARALDAVDEQVGLQVLREWAHDWPAAWDERLLAIVSDRTLSEGGRLLAVRALEARVLEQPGLEPNVTRTLAMEVSFADGSTALRLACLDVLANIQRSNPDWLARLRRAKRLEPSSSPTWAEWRKLSSEQRTLTAALVDPAELERALATIEEGAEADALEMVEIHVRHDASSARRLSVLVRPLMTVARAVLRGAAPVVLGHIAEQRHAELVRDAVAFDRARGELSLSWVEPALVEAVVAAARLGIALEAEPRFEAHVRLWTDLFRDGGHGLASRLLEIVRSTTSLDSPMPAACVAIHALADVASERRHEATRRVLEALRRAQSPDVGAARARGPSRPDVLVAMVAPDHVLELQDARVLPSVDVPTEEEHAKLYHDDASTLARQVRLSRVVDVLERGTDVERVGIALLVLPNVVRWLPRELTRFEPLVRKHLENARSLRGSRTATRKPLGAADVGTIGHRAFDVYLRCLIELGLLRQDRRPTVALEHIAAHLADTAAASIAHGHSARALATAVKEVLRPEQTAAARSVWLQTLLARGEDCARRLDAHAALEVLSEADGGVAIGGAVEQILTRDDDPEIGALLVEAFERGHPDRFEALRRDGRLRIGLPTIERLFTCRHEDGSRRNGLQLLEGRCRAIASAVSAEDVIATVERGEPAAQTLAAIHLVRFALVERDPAPALVKRARAALAARTSDLRTHEAVIEGQRELFAIAPAAFGVYLSVLAIEPAASPEVAVAALMSTLDQARASLEDERAPGLERAHAIVRRFAESASATMRRAAVSAMEARLERLFRSTTRDVETLEALVRLYAEGIELVGGAAVQAAVRERFHRVFTGRDSASAGARYCAFRVLSAQTGADPKALLDLAVRMFMDEGTDGALRTLIGSVITISRPDAFEHVVDMNTQPWLVRAPQHRSLPASSLPANMPSTWLVAVLRMADHDEPHRRATAELASRLVPAKAWEWRKVPARWLELVGGDADRVRQGLRSVLERPEPKHAAGHHANAARLLALFGNEEDERLLATAATAIWVDREPPLEPVFWRPAGKAPALGEYSFLEIYLEVAFGSDRRYRILSEAYALAAERADARGEGGTASRYAYEAFLLAPDSPRATGVLERFNQ